VIKLADTTVRVSASSYSNLVKTRGILEAFHYQGRRLSLDNTVYISTQFAYEVASLIMKEMDKSVVFASDPEGARGGTNPATGVLLGPGGSEKIPPKFLAELMGLTEVLFQRPPRPDTKK